MATTASVLDFFLVFNLFELSIPIQCCTIQSVIIYNIKDVLTANLFVKGPFHHVQSALECIIEMF